MAKYVLVMENDPVTLCEEVNKMLVLGWKLVGGISVYYDQSIDEDGDEYGMVLAQAMILPGVKNG